ncbi:hypothetical protein AB0K16_25905 [Nonomuraea jabiensis]|uniref:hypothetical protein n=1 Tax=Nonomuraea jabiensis TaxID=882448 RepID=UPI00342F9325
MTLPEVESPARQDAGWPLEVVTARRPLRWLGAACVLVVLGMVASALVANPAWEWDIVGQYLFAPSVVRSVPLTLELTALGIALGFVLGAVLALMRLSPNRPGVHLALRPQR